MAVSPVDEILAPFTVRGHDSYLGEAVTQTQHALQAAWLATQDSAPPALIIAALLHDVGHLLHHGGEDIADRGIDARHEEIGARWLSRWLGPAITGPIRLHVAAKRYLCRVDAGYQAQLSEASRQSLALQGGAFSDAEVEAFQRQEHWKDAVRLRRYDEAAKVIGRQAPPWEAYRPLLAQWARQSE